MNFVLGGRSIGAVLGRSGGSAGVAPIQPDALSNLQLWLKADALAYSDGQTVASWTDASGNSRNAFPLVNTTPTFKTNQINAKPAVRFDGVDDRMGFTGVNWGTVFTNSAYTLLIVASVSSNSNNANGYQNDALIGENGGYGAMYARSTGKIGAYNWDGSNDVAEVDYTLGTWAIFSQQLSGGTLSIRKNNGTPGTVVTGNTSVVGSPLTIGSSSNTPANCISGDIAEIICYNVALSAANRQGVEAYLSAKYGISLA